MLSLHRAEQDKFVKEEMSRIRAKMYPEKRKEKTNEMANKAMARSRNWTTSKLLDQNLTQTLKEGITPIAHPLNHNFRDRKAGRELGAMSVYSRTYQPAKARAETTEKAFREAHIRQPPFRENTKIQRDRVENKELGPAMHYGNRTENERIHNNIKNSPVDLAIADTCMLTNPSWKDINKHRWLDSSKRNFDTTSCTYQGRRSNDPWKTISTPINKGDKYRGGFDEVGDLSRQRSKQLELENKDFMTTFKSSHYKRYDDVNSKSVRSFKSDQFQKFAEADSTNWGKFYPKTLLSTLSEINNQANRPPSIVSQEDVLGPKPSEHKTTKNIMIMEVPSLSNVGMTPRTDTMKSKMLRQNTLSASQQLRASKLGFSGSVRSRLKMGRDPSDISSKVSTYFDDPNL